MHHKLRICFVEIRDVFVVGHFGCASLLCFFVLSSFKFDDVPLFTITTQLVFVEN